MGTITSDCIYHSRFNHRTRRLSSRRESVSRAISQLQKDGVMKKFADGRYTINREALISLLDTGP